MTKAEIKVSILICTHNRADDVTACLRTLSEREIPENYEVILVDSGSTGDDAARVADYAGKNPYVNFCRLDKAGTSLARNTALKMARGEWVWWLDDDALPDRQWPEQLEDTIDASDTRIAVIGGRVTPIFPEGSDTRHLTPRWKLLISSIDDDTFGSVSDGYNVACANMLMRRLPVLSIGGFSEHIGRIGAQHLVSGEENLVIEMLQAEGYEAQYTPNLKVRHKVAGNRLTLDWVARRAYAEGISIYRINSILNRPASLRQHPLKLNVAIFVFNVLLFFVPNDPDLIIRKNIAKGILAAGGK